MAQGRPRSKNSLAYRRRKRKVKIVLTVTVLVALLAAFMIAMVVVAKPYESVDLCDLAVIEYGGYNTAGEANVSMDDERVVELMASLKEDYNDATFHSKKPSDEDYLKFRQSLSVSLDTTNGLSNGSVINMTCSYDEELAKLLKLDVECDTRQITVGGLPTVTKLSVDQVFENLEVDFTGVSPNLTMTMVNNSPNPLISQMSFEILNPKEFYSQGDVVSVMAHYTQEQCLASSYIVDASPDDCVKDYEVVADSKYVDEASQLPSSLIDEAVSAGKKAFKDANEYGVRIFCEANLVPVYINKKATFEYGEPKLVSAYFKTIFPDKAGNIAYDYNDLDIIYSVVITQADGVSCTAYAAVRFSNIIKNDNGTFNYDFSDPKILSESYFAARVKKNVTDSYANTHDIEKVR